MTTMIWRRALVAAALMTPGLASAQALECRIGGAIPRPHLDGATPDQPRRIVPIGGYMLSIGWSPEYCRGKSGGRDDFQCGAGNRFGFTLHGLWPDGRGKDWPQYCRPAALLPERTIKSALCATPSAQLLQHEWAKHGTCMAGQTPDRYFARSAAMFRALRFPDMDALSRQSGLTAGRLASAIASANPGLRADGIRITANARGWLQEAWLCHDVRLRPRRCPAHQGGASPGAPIRIQRLG